MQVKKNAPLFGVSIDPAAAVMQEAFARAGIAEAHGLDMITIMDHPYNRRLFDTWTLLAALSQATRRVNLATNVLNLPLRPPAMLAKQAASLDVLSNGRLVLGLGAGAYWDGIEAFGGPRRAPGEAYQAFEDALHILRGMWEHSGGSYTYEGEIYRVRGAKPGPKPAHRIPIWVGGRGPRMLTLLGRMADGLFTSYNYVKPDTLSQLHAHIDAGAEDAGRHPSEIRRGYNLMGVIDLDERSVANVGQDYLSGDVKAWVSHILDFYYQARMDAFIFWPIEGDKNLQVETFARQVVPAVKERLG